MTSFLSIALLLGSIAGVAAQTVLPSNATVPPPASGVNLKLYLSDSHQMKKSEYLVVPLTKEAGLGATATEILTWRIPGTIRLVDSTNANSIGTDDITYVTCDADDSLLSPARIIQTVVNNNPRAVLLYTTKAVSCNLTGSFGYPSIYTMTSASDAKFLEMSLQVGQSPTDAVISANSTQTNTQGTNNDGGPAPTTAVAMSILYSVTGIITLLFLVVITTGALRAHRHPERYGPRRALGGRPRQSRAKGLARAMLETIPIVKFGDPEPPKNEHGRVIELEDGTQSVGDRPALTAETSEDTQKNPESKKADKAPGSETSPAEVASGMGAATSASVHSGEDSQPHEDGLVCSICTEEFTAGEDVRLLPCNHKFHPACVDQWLLNVSGTCPLCRHDLNPTKTNTSADETADAETTVPPPPPAAEPYAQRDDPAFAARRRVSRFLDLHRLRHAPPDERIAALRRLREESRAEGAPVEDSEESSGGARLTNRLRDRFRVGTRQHPATPAQAAEVASAETEAPASGSAQNSTPRDAASRQEPN